MERRPRATRHAATWEDWSGTGDVKARYGTGIGIPWGYEFGNGFMSQTGFMRSWDGVFDMVRTVYPTKVEISMQRGLQSQHASELYGNNMHLLQGNLP